MTPSWFSLLPHAELTAVSVALCVPGYLLAAGRADAARDVLLDLAAAARDGFILDGIVAGGGGGAGRGGAGGEKPDVCSTLWFARAAYFYRKAAGPAGAWADRFLPLIKKSVQTLISGGTADTRMDDGGMLAPTAMPPAPAPSGPVAPGGATVNAVCPMGINALWYFTLAMLAEELHAINDRAGDHFERLCGRFRRSFTKAFWCSAHGFLCDPGLQRDPDHAAAHAVPDPTQLLIATLPFSPVPRTKQRQIALAVREKSLAPRGVLMPRTSPEGGLKGTDAPDGTASALHLAWLVEALVATSDTPEKAAAEARPLLPPPGPVARFYVGEAPAAIAENENPHAPSTAETNRARQLVA